MKAPRPWTESPSEAPPELHDLLEKGRKVVPFSAEARGRIWRELERRTGEGEGSPRIAWWGAAAGTVALLLAMVLALHGVRRGPGAPPAERVVLGGVGELEVTPGAVYRLPERESPGHGYHVALDSGRVCARVRHRDVVREGPFVVEAPGMRVFVVGTSFCVEAGREGTVLSVSEGKVRVERPGAAVRFVAAGESLRAEPAVAPAPVPAALPPLPSPVGPAGAITAPPSRARAVARCLDQPSLSRRADCYAAVAAGDDLAAQNALFALALLQRNELHDGPSAIAFLHNYLARFPGGVLAPEVRQTLIAELADEHRPAEALAESERYLRTATWDGRTAEVALLRANLLRSSGANAEARSAYQDILKHEAPAAVRDDASFGAAMSALDLGMAAEARADLREYQRENPEGKHAGEVRRALAGQAP